MIVLIVGLPGAGKTTLACELAKEVPGIVLDGDAIRNDLSKDLGFSKYDRIEQARRIGAIARLLDAQGHNVYCSFVCPTQRTRDAFGERDILVWVNRISNRHFDDSTEMWENPEPNVEIDDTMTLHHEVDLIKQHLK
jgi:adenylylsulfate kinase